ncbi:4'-phosphopantetheinyl transferase family protein [Luteimonas aquatica]|uniref:4'-phosphopantetheinyl transferase family protein n=1 Tax=Luteimonas aquatica TaxID=450364 RepID=UPI001F5A6BFC|nr:4'-phosphopantetheinyl transferase superfamily protein [Luteimonas aquatica]
MFDPGDSLDLGPVRCAWGPYRHGQSAEALVRPQLARWLQTPAETLSLVRDAYGRPRLDPNTAFDASWSHSGDGLLLALGAGVRVGADLEWLRPRPRMLALAERFFTPGETSLLAAWPEAGRETAFVRLWCAKEAVLKAHGRGLVFGLDRLEFAYDGQDWRLVACDPALGTPADWTLRAFAPMPGYEAVVAWAKNRA